MKTQYIVYSIENGFVIQDSATAKSYYVPTFDIQAILKATESPDHEMQLKALVLGFSAEGNKIPAIKAVREYCINNTYDKYRGLKEAKDYVESLRAALVEKQDKIDAFVLIVEDLEADVERYKSWVNDLHSGMYINCVYCGHQYGPKDRVSMAMADVLKEHIEKCPKHPMSLLRAENERLEEDLRLRNLLPREQQIRNAGFTEGWDWILLTNRQSVDTQGPTGKILNMGPRNMKATKSASFAPPPPEEG